MICNLAKFRPNITQPSTGPPSSLPWSGFSGISWSVILIHMWFIHTGSLKSVNQSSSLEWCNTFVFPVCTFLTTYAGTQSACRFPWYAGHYPTSSSASATDREKHPASPVHGLQIATLRPLPYGHTDTFAVGPLSEQSLVRSSQTSGDACTASRHTCQWYVSGCVPDKLGTAGQ